MSECWDQKSAFPLDPKEDKRSLILYRSTLTATDEHIYIMD